MDDQMRRMDRMVRDYVLWALFWDREVQESDLSVEVDMGLVTLSGAVSTWDNRMAAQRAARRALGVIDVFNDIEVLTSEAPSPPPIHDIRRGALRLVASRGVRPMLRKAG
jgi:hypothetical protein